MIKVENIEVWGWNGAIRGMRNPLNSWKRMDSYFDGENFIVGDNDMALMQKLYKGGTEHRKYLRMVHIQMDITAPMYWWKEYDTYKIGTVANSCSTMHKLASRDLTLKDFSHEHLFSSSLQELEDVINWINYCITCYRSNNDKRYWWQAIQVLPMSYNQRRTVDFNYETAITMIRQRQAHKLDEWQEFVSVLRGLPYLQEITGYSADIDEVLDE